MSPRRTRRGTIRESVIEAPTVSSLKNTSKITKRSRRVNKKDHATTSEDDSESPVEVHSSESVVSASILNESSSKAKKRKGVALEASVSQDSSLSVTIEQSKRKNAKTPRTKKQTTSSRSRAKEAQALLSDEESSNVKPEKRVSYNLTSDSEEQSGMSPRKKAKSSKKEGKIPEKSPERVSSKNISTDKNVTPKTSPALNVSFTPHRSKKTPRKSPVNLGSPKTRSPNPAKFLIVPRKLSIVDSPPSSENSLQQNNSSNSVNVSIQNISKSNKSSKSKSSVSSSKKITPFKPRPTFSKSPKIVLKTPKAKSKKTTPKGSAASAKSKKSSPLKQKKSPVKSDESSKSRKSTKNESLSVTENISGLIDFDDTITTSSATSPKKSANTSVKSPVKSPKATSPAKSKLDLLSSSLRNIPKVVLSSVSPKTHQSPKPASIKSKSSPKKASPIKLAVSSPKTKLAFISKGTPKIVLIKKSPVKSAKKTSPAKSKSSSPLKTNKSPSKSENSSVNASQVSSLVEISSDMNSTITAKPASSKKSKKSPSPSKSKKSPIKSSRSSPNVSSKKTPNTSSTGLPLNSKKMPKIVLKKKSPIKSSKSMTPTSARKPSKVTAAPKTSKVNTPKSTPVSKTSPKKQQPRKSSPTKNTSKNTTMSPKVVMSKLSSPELKNNSLRAKENQPSVTLVPVDHATHKSEESSSKSPKSAKSPKSVAKRSIAATAGSKAATPFGALDNKFLNLKPKNTSTPSEKGKLTRSPLGKSKIIKRLNEKSAIQVDQPFLEDESEPSLDESSLIRLSDVFDVDTPRKNNTFEKNSSKTKLPKASQELNKSDTFEVDNSPKNASRRSNRSGTFEVTKASPSPSAKSKVKKNNTYEVNEPKTPGIQDKSIKRTVNQARLGLDGEASSKKNRKVNFASPARESARASSINRIGTPAHPMHQRKTPVSVNKAKTPLKSAVRSRISAVGLGNKTPMRTPLSKRKSITGDDPSKSRRSNYDAQVASVNRLSRPKAVTESQKKLEKKTPVIKKIPNFAEIHQKNFAKMESLVDLKKRVEKRHVLNTESGKKLPDSSNGAYTRFGFKVRKNEAVNLISKKQPASADSRQYKRENARSALKGVRMNRRFELQMKARIKTS